MPRITGTRPNGGAADFNRLFLADEVSIRGDDLDAPSRTAIRYTGQFEPPALLS